MASIKTVISENFRADCTDLAAGEWTLKATSKIAKSLLKIKGMKSGLKQGFLDVNALSASIETLEADCAKLAKISGNA